MRKWGFLFQLRKNLQNSIKDVRLIIEATAMRSLCFRQNYSYVMSTPRIKHHTIDSVKKGDFFLHRGKKGRCFFATGSKMVCTKVPHSIKKYITSLHQYTYKLFTKCFLQNLESFPSAFNQQKYKDFSPP
jgi:hypothetical protein